MKTILLTQNKVALVDDADFESVSQFNWCIQKRKYGFHAVMFDGKRNVYLHRFLMPGVPSIDHIDGNGLNNQRYNLRPASKQQNAQAFQRKAEGKSSRFRGVSLHKQTQKWRSAIGIGGKTIYLGLFVFEQDAASMYDAAARELFGEFASPNFKI